MGFYSLTKKRIYYTRPSARGAYKCVARRRPSLPLHTQSAFLHPITALSLETKRKKQVVHQNSLGNAK